MYGASDPVGRAHPNGIELNRIAASGKRKRSEFVRQAIRKATRQAEYQLMCEAYHKQPDSILDADDWSTVEDLRLEQVHRRRDQTVRAIPAGKG